MSGSPPYDPRDNSDAESDHDYDDPDAEYEYPDPLNLHGMDGIDIFHDVPEDLELEPYDMLSFQMRLGDFIAVRGHLPDPTEVSYSRIVHRAREIRDEAPGRFVIFEHEDGRRNSVWFDDFSVVSRRPPTATLANVHVRNDSTRMDFAEAA